MKLFIMLIGFLYAINLQAQVRLPVGNYKYESQSLIMAHHFVLFYNSSSSDMGTMAEFRQNGYACKRFSRVHRCKKTVDDLSFEVEQVPPFLELEFNEPSGVEALILEADPEQYMVSQMITYDGKNAESENYNLYVKSDGATYLDPTLGELVRFEFLSLGDLTHLGVFNKKVSEKESYRLYTTFIYIRK